jgi:arsenite methyltransferase
VTGVRSFGTVSEIKQSCCAAWQHPAARLLLGDHLHPGGRALTETAIEATGASAGDIVLDVGCGHGPSLRLMRELGIRAVGIDLSEPAAREASLESSVLVGDGERLPLSPGSFDGALAECVVSLFVDKVRALEELHRVLKPGSRVVLSDVVVEEPLDPVIDGTAAWSCCVGGAVSRDDYVRLLSGAGFVTIETRDQSEALIATIQQVRRRLSLFEMSAEVGQVDLEEFSVSSGVLERARTIAAILIDEVLRGALGYFVITARKP